MRIDFSKPCSDVDKESFDYLKNNNELLARQNKISLVLSNGDQRLACIICADTLNISAVCFRHRNVEYVICPSCGHIQSKIQPPNGYPIKNESKSISFSKIYTKLNDKEYSDRKNRIYKPKLDWVLSCHKELGLTTNKMIDSKWLELGSGAGYFLYALKQAGIDNFCGFEREPELVNISKSFLGRDDSIKLFNGSLSDIVKNSNADIYVAFFVLEHIEYTRDFLLNMRNKRKGTVFLFSVPTFGFSTILESAFNQHFARHLDSSLHTQLFSDLSIKHCLRMADYEIVAKWIFGQDSNDLYRMIITALRNKYPESLLSDISNKISMLQDPVQSLLDTNYLADSQHILAVKN